MLYNASTIAHVRCCLCQANHSVGAASNVFWLNKWATNRMRAARPKYLSTSDRNNGTTLARAERPLPIYWLQTT